MQLKYTFVSNSCVHNFHLCKEEQESADSTNLVDSVCESFIAMRCDVSEQSSGYGCRLLVQGVECSLRLLGFLSLAGLGVRRLEG